jgi:hypothetical protein
MLHELVYLSKGLGIPLAQRNNRPIKLRKITVIVMVATAEVMTLVAILHISLKWEEGTQHARSKFLMVVNTSLLNL